MHQKKYNPAKKKLLGMAILRFMIQNQMTKNGRKRGGGAEGGAEFAVCALFADVDEILWQSSRGTWGDVSCKPWLVPPLGTDTSNGLVENFG